MRPNYRKIIDDLIVRNNIIIKKWRSTNSGRAYPTIRSIEIPEPKSIDRFMTCLHEIGHITKDSLSNPVWKSEYIASKYAFDFCEENAISVSSFAENHSRNYIKMIIAKGLIRRLQLKNVSDEVLMFAKIDRELWQGFIDKGYKPFVKSTKRTWKEVEVIWSKK